MSKVGRNDPCPCGSGKKAKRCCMEKLEADRRNEVLSAQREQFAAKAERLEAEREDLQWQLERAEAEARADEVGAQVNALLDAGQLEEAEAVGLQLEGIFPGEETVGMGRLAELYESRGMRGEAVAHYRRAVSRMDELGRGHYCDCCRTRMVEAIGRLDPDHAAPALGIDPQ
jgi:uncharacterized protein (UPF0335 family)